MTKILPRIVILTAMLAGLPLAGALVAGRPLAQYLEFPPLTRYVQHQPFSTTAFLLLSVITALLFIALGCLSRAARKKPAARRPDARFPGWGWPAGLVLATIWFLAWTRYPWFEFLQAYTFTPLWLSFIVLVNALTFANRGRCLLTHQRRLLLWLFPVSSVFWWYFEYLNRYVQNWYYLGIDSFSPTIYVIHASLAFSTVLPAVASVTDYLASLSFFGRQPYTLVLTTRPSRGWPWMLLVSGALGLAGIAAWPNYLFPLLWITPLMLFVALQMLAREPDFFSAVAGGRNWKLLAPPALAALLCGLLWEMWNYYSYAKWQYSIPFVQAFKLFEMPIPGYAGYPLFGVECVVVTQWLRGLLDPLNRHPA